MCKKKIEKYFSNGQKIRAYSDGNDSLILGLLPLKSQWGTCTLRKVQKIRVVLGKSENTFELLQWASMRNRYFQA